MIKKIPEGRTRILFGTGDILGGGAFTLLSLLYLHYLVNVQSLSPGLAGLLLLIGKLFDAVIDPFLGCLSDRSRSRLGRRRVFFLIGIVPVFITFVALWYGFGISTQAGKFVYFLAAYCLFCGASSLVCVPYNALLPEIAPGYDQRTSFMSTRMLFSISSSIIAGVVPLLIVGRFSDAKTGYLVMALVFGLLYALPWIFVFIGTRENPLAGEKTKERPTRQLAGIFKNRTFRYYIAMFLTGMAAVDLLLALLIYYVTSVLGRPNEFPVVTGITIFSQLIGSQIWAAIAKKHSKTTPLKIGGFIWAAGLFICVLLTKASPPWYLYGAAVLMGIGGISCNQTPWSVLPDVVDVGELVSGKRQEGLYSGVVTFIRQSANALSMGLSGLLLQLAGYAKADANGIAAVQTEATIFSLRLIYVFSPLLFLAAAVLLAWLYPLSRKRFGQIRKARALLSEGKPLGDDALRKDIFTLTGVPEEMLWGHNKRIETEIYV
jgi:oligogalacturonide transporter